MNVIRTDREMGGRETMRVERGDELLHRLSDATGFTADSLYDLLADGQMVERAGFLYEGAPDFAPTTHPEGCSCGAPDCPQLLDDPDTRRP